MKKRDKTFSTHAKNTIATEATNAFNGNDMDSLRRMITFCTKYISRQSPPMNMTSNLAYRDAKRLAIFVENKAYKLYITDSKNNKLKSCMQSGRMPILHTINIA